jgi:hypothetical protein
MARNNLKYVRVDIDKRAALRREWNQPIVWPVVLILAVLVVGSIPAFVSYRRREQKSGSEPDKSGSEPKQRRIGL